MRTESGSRGPAGAAAGDGLPGGPASGPRGDRGDAASSWRAECGAARRALSALREHPRHLVLAALVIGLLLPHAGAAIVVPAALVATLAGRALPACLAVAALLGGREPRRRASRRARRRRRRQLARPGARPRARWCWNRCASVPPVRPSPASGCSRASVPVSRWSCASAATPTPDGCGRRRAAARAAAPGRARPAAPARGWPEVGDVVVVRGKIEPLGRLRRLSGATQRPRRDRRDARRPDRRAARRRPRRARRRSARGRARAGERPRARPRPRCCAAWCSARTSGSTQDVKDDFQASGLAHILAVSGQNVMLLAILVLGACALVGVPLQARLLLAAALIVLYVPLDRRRAVDPASRGDGRRRPGRRARRAAVASLVRAAAGRRAHAGAQPARGGGARLAAVVRGRRRAARRRRAAARRRSGARMPGPVAEAAAITIAATVGTAPLMALHFGEVSLASLPANLLAAPAIAPVMWLGVLAAAAAQVAEPLAAPFSALTGPLLVYLQTVARADRGTRRSPSSRSTPRPPRSPPAAWRSSPRAALARPALATRASRAEPRSPPARRRTRRLVVSFGVSRRRGLLAIAGGVPGDATLPRRAAGRAARVVPRHRPGRRDVDRARRHDGARRHGAAGRPDPRAARGGRRRSVSTR